MDAYKKYLIGHGINDNSIKKFNLSWDKDYLHIPIEDEDGKPSFTKSRYLHFTKEGDAPKYKNSLGSHTTLFNFHRIGNAGNVVLCEGEIDAIRLMQEGISSLSSTGGAGSFPKEFIKDLEGREIYICFDNDPAGERGIRMILDYLPDARVIQLPKEVKDICEFFKGGYTLGEFKERMHVSLSRAGWELKHLPEEFKLISAQELINKEFPKMPWLIEGIIYDQGYCFIYGAEGTGKSYIALDMAMAIAKGEDWLHTFKVPQAISVLYLDKENPHSLMSKRVKGLLNDEEIPPKNLYFLEYPSKFQLHDGKGSASDFAIALSTLVKEKEIGLIIIDSLIDVMVGSENSSEDTQRFIEAVNHLFPDVAKLPLHHENKPSGGTFRNASQRLRGSSNLNAQAFTMFRLEAVAKSKSEVTLHQTKARDELKMDKFMIKMDVEHLSEEEGGGTVISRFTYMGVVTTGEHKKFAKAEELVIEVLAEANTELCRQDLLAILKNSDISERTMADVLKSMLKEDTLKKTRKGKQVWYELLKPETGKIEDGRML